MCDMPILFIPLLFADQWIYDAWGNILMARQRLPIIWELSIRSSSQSILGWAGHSKLIRK